MTHGVIAMLARFQKERVSIFTPNMSNATVSNHVSFVACLTYQQLHCECYRSRPASIALPVAVRN